MDGHEPPYVDRGWTARCESEHTPYDPDDARTEPGHVYAIETDIYTDEAGYRHSDTVLVTAEGSETLTHFPRDLVSTVVR
jgi:Xaa-Pro aminopeptidase